MNTATKNVKMNVPIKECNMYLYSFFKTFRNYVCKYNIFHRNFDVFIFFYNNVLTLTNISFFCIKIHDYGK